MMVYKINFPLFYLLLLLAIPIPILNHLNVSIFYNSIKLVMKTILLAYLLLWYALPLYQLTQNINKTTLSAFMFYSSSTRILVDGLYSGNITISSLIDGQFQHLQTIDIGTPVYSASFLRNDTILIITASTVIYYF